MIGTMPVNWTPFSYGNGVFLYQNIHGIDFA
jgi:hypothetical protein